MTITPEDLLFWLITAGVALLVIGFILGEMAAKHHHNHHREGHHQ